MYTKDSKSYTQLHFAVLHDHKSLVELLVKKADVNAKSTDLQDTPLHLAAMAGHKDVAELLLADKAEVDVKNSWGRGH